jgi:hypothetical protein
MAALKQLHCPVYRLPGQLLAHLGPHGLYCSADHGLALGVCVAPLRMRWVGDMSALSCSRFANGLGVYIWTNLAALAWLRDCPSLQLYSTWALVHPLGCIQPASAACRYWGWHASRCYSLLHLQRLLGQALSSWG